VTTGRVCRLRRDWKVEPELHRSVERLAEVLGTVGVDVGEGGDQVDTKGRAPGTAWWPPVGEDARPVGAADARTARHRREARDEDADGDPFEGLADWVFDPRGDGVAGAGWVDVKRGSQEEARRPPYLEGTDVAVRTLRPSYAALVGRRAAGVVASVDRRAPREKSVRERRAAVVGERPKERIRVRKVARAGELARVGVFQVVAERCRFDRAGAVGGIAGPKLPETLSASTELCRLPLAVASRRRPPPPNQNPGVTSLAPLSTSVL
jgi:hypothetical protein